MLTNYNGFLLEKLKFELFSLLEGYLYANTDFILRLSELVKKGGKVGSIAKSIKDVIEDEDWVEDVKQNYFDVIDGSTDMVGFINDDKVRSDIDPFTMSGRSQSKIGRIINYICKISGISITDKEREDFVNAWKAITDVKGIQFKLVSGKDIAKYYDEDKYYSGQGTLGSSCMRDVGSGPLRIYTENKNKVKLLIYVDEDDKIHGRALVWKLDKSPCESKYFMDRVYANRDSDIEKFKNFADEKGWFYRVVMNSCNDDAVIFKYKGNTVFGKIDVKLDGDFNEYPYLDTLVFLNKKMTKLSNLPNKEDWMLQNIYSNKKIMCSTCYGDIIIKNSNDYKSLCYNCALGHEILKDNGIETKWNRKVD